MDLVIIEEKKSALDAFRQIFQEAVMDCRIHCFSDLQDAILHIMNDHADAVVVGSHAESDMGIKMARILRNIWRDLDIMICAENGECAAEAYRLHCCGYVVRPLTVERAREEMQYLRKRRPVTHPNAAINEVAEDKGLQIITFGNFEVFFNGRPIAFKYNKTKELFAYLVDRRGSMCTNREISAVLWEDDDYKKHLSYFSNLRNDLMTTLGRIGRSDTILHKRGMMGINVTAVNCDLFNCLRIIKRRSGARVSAKEVAYQGEYMSQYSWAEESNSTLSQLLDPFW